MERWVMPHYKVPQLFEAIIDLLCRLRLGPSSESSPVSSNNPLIAFTRIFLRAGGCHVEGPSDSVVNFLHFALNILS
jgi:hypothetical protein